MGEEKMTKLERIAELVQSFYQTHSAKETIEEILDVIQGPGPRPAAGPWIAVAERKPEAGKPILFATATEMHVGRYAGWGWICDRDQNPEGAGAYGHTTHWAEIRRPE